MENNKKTTTINCFKCKNFFITYDPRFPYGCSVFGCKTKLSPAVEVLRNSGKECLYFEKKLEKVQI